MAYVGYRDNSDGTYSFLDETGQHSMPMAGPAAMQQKLKLDAQAPPPAAMVQPSPELLAAAAPPLDDQRMASLQLGNSIMDAGGAPGLTPDQAKLDKLMNSGMTAFEAKEYIKQQDAFRQNSQGIKDGVTNFVSDVVNRADASGVEQKNAERQKAGLPPLPPKAPPAPAAGQAREPSGGGEGGIVPEADRIQLSGAKMQQGLQFAPTSSAGASPARLAEVKAGETTGYTTIDPQNVANIKRADQNRYEAAEQMGAAQEKAGQQMTAELAQIPQGLTELERQRQLQEESITQRIQQDHEKLDALRNETRREVDPNAFWKNKTAGEKFAGALAMGAGAFAQAMGGGPNAAMQIINNSIREEIDAQKENIKGSHQRFQDMRGQMSERKQLFQDERQNFVAKKVAYLEHANSKLSAMERDAKTDEARAKIAEFKAIIQKESEMMMADFSKVSHQVQTKTVQVGGGVAGPKGNGMSELDHEKYVPQFGGLAPTKEEAVLARQKGASLDSMRRLISENVRLRDQPDSYIKGSDNYAKLKSNQSQVILTLKRKENEDLGVIAGPDMQLMLDALGDGSSIVPGQTAAMKNFLGNQNRVNENVRRNIGLIPVETAPIRDEKTGETRIGQQITGNVVTPNNVTGHYNAPVQTVHIAKTARQDKK